MKFLWSVMFVFLSFFAHAEEPVELVDPIEKKLEKCLGEVTTNSGVRSCLYSAWKDWDEELNRVYKALMQHLSKESKLKLKLSQRAWLKHRDLEIEFLSGMFSEDKFMGTIYSVISLDYKVEVIKKRTLMLQVYLNEYK